MASDNPFGILNFYFFNKTDFNDISEILLLNTDKSTIIVFS